MRRRLATLLMSMPAVLAAPGAADADWSGPIDVPGATGNPIELSFDPVGQGLLRWGDQYLSRSLDDGVTWPVPLLYPTGADVEVGSDAAGNRVWAYAIGTKIRMVRTGPEGGPTAAGYQDLTVPSRNDLELSVDAAGDALVAWTSSDGAAGAAFWAAGASAPGAPQTFASVGTSSASTPVPVLDAAGHSATVAFTGANNGGHVYQAQATDAAQSNAFGTPTVLASNATLTRGGQGPDGRALLVLRDAPTIPTNAYGQTTTLRYLVSSRGPGGAFGPPTVLAGDDARLVAFFATSVPIAPNGRTILGYATNVNRPGGSTCAQTLGEQHTEVAVGTIDAAGQTSLSTSTLSASGAGGGLPATAAGPDGRLAAIWQELTACTPAVSERHATIARPDGALTPIAPPAFSPTALAFTGTGALYQVGYPPSGSFKGLRYETDFPLVPPAGPAPAGPGPSPGAGTPPSPDPAAGSAPPPSPAVVTVKPGATATVGRVTAGKDGSLKIIIRTTAAGTLTLSAKAGKAVVAKATKKVAKAGSASVVLKPTRAALKTLRAKGRLKARLTIAFRPAAGAAPAAQTRSVTFTRRR